MQIKDNLNIDAIWIKLKEYHYGVFKNIGLKQNRWKNDIHLYADKPLHKYNI